MTPQKTTQRKSKTVVAKTPKKVELPPNPFVHEILEHVSKQRSRVAKVEALKEHRNPPERLFFSNVQVNINMKNNFSIPEGNQFSKLYLKGFWSFWFPPPIT